MKSTGKILILIIILVVVLIVGGVLGYILITKNSSAAATPKTGPLYETDELTVNASESVSHYIKAQFALEMSSDKVKTGLDEKKPILKDAIINVLAAQSVEDLNTPQGKEALKAGLLKAVNKFLTKGQITKVYIESLIFS